MESIESMRKVKRISLIAMVLMTLFSFTNLIGFNMAGMSVILGVVFFFINDAIEKQPTRDNGLDIKAIGSNLKDKRIWFWIVLPLIMDAICIAISLLFLPEYIEYEIERAGAFVSIKLGILPILQFLFFALGEEIAWRAFFQKQLNKALPIVPVLLISSLLFALGHFEVGNPVIVLYGLFFTFINSILYGMVFYKTNNAWVSTISHFVANIFSVIIFILL